MRWKARFPAVKGSSGHRLFISAFMIASKVACDDTYSNKSWTVVGQGMVALREINQMQREMCGYLEWQLGVKGGELTEFKRAVEEYAGPGPYQPFPIAGFVSTAAKGDSTRAAIPSPGAPRRSRANVIGGRRQPGSFCWAACRGRARAYCSWFHFTSVPSMPTGRSSGRAFLSLPPGMTRHYRTSQLTANPNAGGLCPPAPLGGIASPRTPPAIP
jgi:hypothetical protein